MRVTNNMMTDNLLFHLNRNLSRMENLQFQEATGKRVRLPSDDPVATANILSRKSALGEVDQYLKNTEDALNVISVTEAALKDNASVLQKIRQMANAASNGALSENELKVYANEIEVLKGQLISNANASFAGRHIFSGFETDKDFLKEDGTFNVVIDEYTIKNMPTTKYEIAHNQSMAVMTNGLKVYRYVKEDNIINDNFPKEINTIGGLKEKGTKGVKEKISGAFDLTKDYSGSNLNIVMMAPNKDGNLENIEIDVDETVLVGSALAPLTEQQVIDAYNDALGDNGKAYFDGANLVIETSECHAVAVANYMHAVDTTDFDPSTHTEGVDIVQTKLTSQDVEDKLKKEDIELLKMNALYIRVNGNSRRLVPDTDFETLTEYAEIMQQAANKEFGKNIVSIKYESNKLTFETITKDHENDPSITISYPSVEGKTTMNSSFPKGINRGEVSSRETLVSKIDLLTDYTAEDLNITLYDNAGNAITIDVDESKLYGSAVRPLKKEKVLEAFNEALGSNGLAYFNKNDELVIESNRYGEVPAGQEMTINQVAGAYEPVYTNGSDVKEAVIEGKVINPTEVLTESEKSQLKETGLNLIVNGTSKTLKSKSDFTTLSEYVSVMQVEADASFGANKVKIEINADNKISVSTVNTKNGNVPELRIDFSKTKKPKLIKDLEDLISDLRSAKFNEIDKYIDVIEDHRENIQTEVSDIGARYNRLVHLKEQHLSNQLSAKELLSDVQDVDLSKVIMNLKNAENVYKASLSTGARVIQPSLLDFLR